MEKSLTIRAVAREYSFWVYIPTNRNHAVLYIGVTNSLLRRACQHREGTGSLFPSPYRCTKLIYYEHFRDTRDAIVRETQLEKWSRAKKIALIKRLNPRWTDIGDQIFEMVRDVSTSVDMTKMRPAICTAGHRVLSFRAERERCLHPFMFAL